MDFLITCRFRIYSNKSALESLAVSEVLNLAYTVTIFVTHAVIIITFSITAHSLTKSLKDPFTVGSDART